MFHPMINPFADIPEDIYDALFTLEINASFSGNSPVSRDEVISYLSDKIETFTSDQFSDDFLMALKTPPKIEVSQG
jgi:hypothetical protein